MNRRWVAAVALLLLSSSIGGLASAQEGAAIRANVNLVNVSFVARDAQGALVDRLVQDDVEVLEDSVPRRFHFLPKARTFL